MPNLTIYIPDAAMELFKMEARHRGTERGKIIVRSAVRWLAPDTEKSVTQAVSALLRERPHTVSEISELLKIPAADVYLVLDFFEPQGVTAHPGTPEGRYSLSK